MVLLRICKVLLISTSEFNAIGFFIHFLDILPRFRGKNLPLATGSTVFKAGFGKFLRVVDVAAIDDEGIMIIPDWRLRRSGIIIVKLVSLNFPPKFH